MFREETWNKNLEYPEYQNNEELWTQAELYTCTQSGTGLLAENVDLNRTKTHHPHQFGNYHHKPYRKHVEFRTKINNTHRLDTKPTTVEAKIIKQSIFDL